MKANVAPAGSSSAQPSQPAPGLSAAELETLRQFDTPTICNVVEMFEVRPKTAGYSDRRLECWFPELKPMVGYAVTATMRCAAAPPASAEPYSMLPRQLDAFATVPAPPIVVIQDIDDPPVAASFGELMAAIYKKFGAAGLITNGPGRDRDQVRAHQLPCFTTGAVAARGYCHFLAVNVPVNICGLTVYPGDLLHGDCNGLTSIPHQIASKVANLCAEYVAAENEILDYVRQGPPTMDGIAAARKRCADKLKQLKTQLKT